jgi:hypothetical protein
MREEKPPILGTWKNLYALVIGVLIALIVVFYFLTKTFS